MLLVVALLFMQSAWPSGAEPTDSPRFSEKVNLNAVPNVEVVHADFLYRPGTGQQVGLGLEHVGPRHADRTWIGRAVLRGAAFVDCVHR